MDASKLQEKISQIKILPIVVTIMIIVSVGFSLLVYRSINGYWLWQDSPAITKPKPKPAPKPKLKPKPKPKPATKKPLAAKKPKASVKPKLNKKPKHVAKSSWQGVRGKVLSLEAKRTEIMLQLMGKLPVKLRPLKIQRSNNLSIQAIKPAKIKELPKIKTDVITWIQLQQKLQAINKLHRETVKIIAVDSKNAID